MSQPRPNNSLPPAKRLPVWIWVVVGIFGVILVVITMIASAGYYVARKFAENPEAIVSKVLAANPNVEIVSRDEPGGKITVRDKSTGKLLVIDYEDAKRGRIRFRDGEKEVVLGAGLQGIEVRKNGKMVRIGPGASHIPAWVPAYPGSSPHASVSEDDPERVSGTLDFSTTDDAARVANYYADALKAAGYTVTREGDFVTGRTPNGAREVRISSGPSGSQTKVTVEFQESKPSH